MPATSPSGRRAWKSGFNPPTDLPTTRSQLEQVKAVAVAEHEWEKVGGTIIDQVQDGSMKTGEAAAELHKRYGATPTFWRNYVRQILEDRRI